MVIEFKTVGLGDALEGPCIEIGVVHFWTWTTRWGRAGYLCRRLWCHSLWIVRRNENQNFSRSMDSLVILSGHRYFPRQKFIRSLADRLTSNNRKTMFGKTENQFEYSRPCTGLLTGYAGNLLYIIQGIDQDRGKRKDRKRPDSIEHLLSGNPRIHWNRLSMWSFSKPLENLKAASLKSSISKIRWAILK